MCTILLLEAGIVPGMSDELDQILAVLIIGSETMASLGAFLLALVSVFILLKPTFFQSKSTFWLSDIAIIQYSML